MKVTVRGNGNDINPQRTKKFSRASIEKIAKAGQPSGWQGQTRFMPFGKYTKG